MTDIVVDASMQASLSDSVLAAITQIGSDAHLSAVLNAASARIVVTDRLPTTATVTDRITGAVTVLTDPTDIAALITGDHAYITAEATTPGSGSPVVFHWDDAGGTVLDGSAVVWLGSEFAAPGHVATGDAFYGMTTEISTLRAVMDGVSRAVADESGAMRGTDGVDHGVGFASMIDTSLVLRYGNPTYSMMERQGPDGYNDSYGSTGSTLVANSDDLAFSIAADGSIVATGRLNEIFSTGGSWTRTDHAVGTTVLDQTYERYSTFEINTNERIFTSSAYGSAEISNEALAGFGEADAQGSSFKLTLAGLAVRDLDTGLDIDRAVQNSAGGVAETIGVDLALWGFGYGLELGHSRMIGIAAAREINMSDSSLSSGMQRLGGDLAYDGAGATDAWNGAPVAAAVAAIDDSASTVNTIIVGGGGGGYMVPSWHHNDGSVDLIQAGSGSDVIVMSDGIDPNGLLRNVAHGNAGHDVIMTGEGSDEVFGDDGNDLVVASVGDDIYHGGLGFDVLNLGSVPSDGLTGLTLDGRSGIGSHLGGSFAFDGFERFVGTGVNDDLTAGAGQVVDGSYGDDVLHLTGSLGIAIGAQGDDTYDIEVAQTGDANFLILGFDQGDTLSFDGIAHAGVRAVGDGQGGWSLDGAYGTTGDPDDFWTETFKADASGAVDGLGLITLQHHVAGSVVGTTNVWIAGFTPGEGGLAFDRLDAGTPVFAGDSNYGSWFSETPMDIVAMFKGPDFVAQPDMFGLV
jgi:hypothetical protein